MKAAFDKWAKAHPWGPYLFCAALIGTAFLPALPAITFYLLINLIAVFVIWGGHKKTLSVLLALSLLALPARAQEQPKPAVYVGCAVVVIVVGTVVTVKLKRFCDKHYKKATNSAPEEFFLSARGGDTSAGIDNWFCEYCTSPPDVSLAPSQASYSETIIEGTIVGGTISLSVVTNIGTYSDFMQEMAALGLPMQPGKHYALNGRPAQQWDVPILFPQERGEVPHVIVNGNNPKTTVVFRSFDLSTWTPILTNTIPAGMISRFEDNTTSASAFYRVTNL